MKDKILKFGDQVIKSMDIEFDERKYTVIPKGHKDKDLVVLNEKCIGKYCYLPTWCLNSDIIEMEDPGDRLSQYYACYSLLCGRCAHENISKAKPK